MAHGMKEEGNYITIPALGRHALLGYLYDERTDQFRGINVFKGPLTGNAIVSTQNSRTSLNMTLVNTNLDKFRLYNIKASIQANLLSGMLQVTGSAEYLQEEKKSAREVKGLMLYECATTVENLQLYFDDLKDQYNTDVVNQSGATHIVTQIKWGGSVAIELSKNVDEENDEQKIKGSLEVVFEKAKGALSIKASASVDLNLSHQKSSTVFSLNVKGDILLPRQIPTTPEQVQQLIQQVPQLIQRTNDGKGVPVEFTLTPLSHLRNHLKQTTRENEFAKQLDESILNDFINTFETISEIGQKLNDYVADFRAYPICVLPQERTDIIRLQTKFTNAKLKFQGQMKETIIAVRSGIKKQEALSQIAEEYEDSEFSPAKIQNKLHDFDHTIRKVELYKTIRKSFPNVQYFGYKSNLKAALLSNIKEVIYALYLFPESDDNSALTQQENEHLFFHKLNHPLNKLFVVDCEFEFAPIPNLKRTVIQQIVNNKIRIEDVNKFVNCQKDDSLPFQMKAIGRFANIGQLYDARTDTFLKYNFLNTNFPDSEICIDEKSGYPEICDVSSENIRHKFESMKVEPELQYSILAEMISLSKSGQYLATEDETQLLNREESFYPLRSFIHLRRLTNRSISVSDPKLIKYFVADALNKGATHFVTTIEYGIQSVFSIGKQLNETDAKGIVSGKIGAETKSQTEQLQNILKRIRIPRTTTDDLQKSNNYVTEKDLEKLKGNFCIQIFSDIQDGYSPEYIKGNQELLFFLNETFVPKQLKSNNRKGMPIAYELYPIANLGIEIGIVSPSIQYGKISKHFPNVTNFIDIFDEISLARNQIRQMFELLETNGDCVTDQDFDLLRNIRQEFDSTIGKLQKEMKHVIKSIKKGMENVDKFKQLLEEYHKLGVLDNNRLYVKLQDMNSVQEKIKIWNQFKNQNVVCIGRPTSENSFNQIFAVKNPETPLFYFLFYHSSWTKSHGDLWRQNNTAFLEFKSDEKKKLFVVICEFENEFYKNVTEPTIHEYTNGILTSRDFIASQKERRFHRNRSIALEESVASLIDGGEVVQNLECGGPVNLPLKGSVCFKYKTSGQRGEEERCLWTFHCNHENKLYGTVLKISLLCDTLDDSHSSDILAIYEWHPSKSLSFFNLRSNKGNLLPHDDTKLRHFMYFQSKSCNPEAAFIIRIDVIKIFGFGSELNWSSNIVPGKVNYDEFKEDRSTSIAICPAKSRPFRFTVDQLDSRSYNGICKAQDSLNIYELGEGGKPGCLGRLCGKITDPISYSTEYPILVIFSTMDSTVGTFRVSWK